MSYSGKKTFVITGSTRGIGASLAKKMLNKGHNVVVNGTSEESVKKFMDNIVDFSERIATVIGSVTEEKTHQKLIDIAVAKFGQIDFWINNAGVPQISKPFCELDVVDFKKVVDVNIYGLMLGTNFALKFMLKQGFGKIFNMEGFGSNGRTMPGLSVYGTSKSAVFYFTKSVAKEVENTPVQIGTLQPGMVRTDFLEKGRTGDDKNDKQFEKVYKYLAEDVELVTEFLASKILISTKNFDRIVFLSKTKLMSKLLRMAFAK